MVFSYITEVLLMDKTIFEQMGSVCDYLAPTGKLLPPTVLGLSVSTPLTVGGIFKIEGSPINVL